MEYRGDSRGEIQPVDELASLEKVLAAARFGIKNVVLPSQNQPDWSEVPAKVREKMKVYFIHHISELLPLVLRGK